MAKRLSIGTWAFTIGPYASNPIDFETVCTKLKALQFDGVELGAFPPHPNPGNPGGGNDGWGGALTTPEQRAEAKARMDAHGLGFSGIAANLWGEKLINTHDSSKYVAEFRKNCEFAVDLGIPSVRVDCVQPPTIHRELDYNTAFVRVVSTWRECARIAAGHGLNMTWEFEPGFAFNKPSDIVAIHDAVDQPNFGLMYDTCHGEMVGVVGARQEGTKEVFANQVELIRKLAGRINHIHLIDSDGSCHKDASGADETSAHPPFGVGRLNFDEILPELIRASRVPHDWWTIDLCFWPDAWAATESCKKYLDQLNAKYGGLAYGA